MNSTARSVRGVGISALMHLALCAAGVLVLLYLAGPNILDPPLRRVSAANLSVLIGDARSSAEIWVALLATISFLASSIWLVIANTSSPAGPQQARSRLTIWFCALVAVIVLDVAAGWWRYWHQNSSDLSQDFLIPFLLVTTIVTLLVFYMACVLGVKASMRPSVPFADAWYR